MTLSTAGPRGLGSRSPVDFTGIILGNNGVKPLSALRPLEITVQMCLQSGEKVVVRRRLSSVLQLPQKVSDFFGTVTMRVLTLPVTRKQQGH